MALVLRECRHDRMMFDPSDALIDRSLDCAPPVGDREARPDGVTVEMLLPARGLDDRCVSALRGSRRSA